MSEQLLLFASFAQDCEHQNEENDTYAECLHPKNHQGNCIEGHCPLARLASLADIKRLDPGLYEEQRRAFVDELGLGWAEEDLFPCDKGSDWVVVDED